MKYGGVGKGVIVVAGVDTEGEENDGAIAEEGISPVGDNLLLFFFFLNSFIDQNAVKVSMRIRTDK